MTRGGRLALTDGEAAAPRADLGEVRRAAHLKRLHVQVRVELRLRRLAALLLAVERRRGALARLGHGAREDGVDAAVPLRFFDRPAEQRLHDLEHVRVRRGVVHKVRIVAEAVPAPLRVRRDVDQVAAVAVVAPVGPAVADVLPRLGVVARERAVEVLLRAPPESAGVRAREGRRGGWGNPSRAHVPDDPASRPTAGPPRGEASPSGSGPS